MKTQHVLRFSKYAFCFQSKMNALLRLDRKYNDRLCFIHLAIILGNSSLFSMKEFMEIFIKIHLLVLLAALEITLFLLGLFLGLGVRNSGTQFLLFFAHD